MRLVPLWQLLSIASAAAWISTVPQRAGVLRYRSLNMQNEDEAGDELAAELKEAASSRLGMNLESLLRPEDKEVVDNGSNIMAQALVDARKAHEERKAEIGEEAAIEELEASIGLRRNKTKTSEGSAEADAA